MYEYERLVDGSYLFITSDDPEIFLQNVLRDASKYALEYLPWDVKEVYESLLNDFSAFFRAAKKLGRELKKRGLSAEEVKIARAVILTAKAVELTLGGGFEGEEKEGSEFLRFVYVGGGKSKAIKKFKFEGVENVDKFRAFASVEASAVTKLCGKLKGVKRDKRALEWFENSEKGFCDVLRALKMFGVDPFVDMKKVDKYVSSL